MKKMCVICLFVFFVINTASVCKAFSIVIENTNSVVYSSGFGTGSYDNPENCHDGDWDTFMHSYGITALDEYWYAPSQIADELDDYNFFLRVKARPIGNYYVKVNGVSYYPDETGIIDALHQLMTFPYMTRVALQRYGGSSYVDLYETQLIIQSKAIPEPTTSVLLMLGLLGIAKRKYAK